MNLRGAATTAEDVYNALIASIEKVYNDVKAHGTIQQGTDEYNVFHNPFGVVDGPCYAFVVHGKGPAVGGQGEIFNDEDDTVTSSQVTIKNNNIKNIRCWNNEVPAAVAPLDAYGNPVEGAKPVNDARGAVFQWVKTFDDVDPYLAIAHDGTYKGNVVADMQIMVAKAILQGVIPNVPERQTNVNSITSDIIAWAESGTTVYEPAYRCNGDSMHHVVKGMIIIRVEDTEGFSIKGNSIQDITNLSVVPFEPASCNDYHLGASSENEDEQQAGNVRAISIAAVRGFESGNSEIKNNNILNLESANANVIIGIDVQGDSSATDIKGNFVNVKEGVGESSDDQYIALRVRENTASVGDAAISVQKNFLVQEAQITNVVTIRRKRKLLAHKSGDIEWKNGGCPFARM